ncbi:hypothetical protein PJL18_02879 [Paenarthrobacter nicotinovorans]|nr:hypothetical protein [Paenarthrobacter nicotinovorans]
MLLLAVVVCGDVAAADVGVLTDFGVTGVAQVGKLGTAADGHVLGFVERADLAGLAQHSARAEVRERSYACLGADRGTGTVRSGHLGTLSHVHVGERRVRTHDGVARHGGGTVQLRVGQQTDVFVEGDSGVDPRGGGVHHGHSGAHPGFDDAAVVLGAECRKLDAVVGTLHLPTVFGHDGGNPTAGVARQTEDIGQVHLALGVVSGHLGQGGPEHCSVEGVDAGVHLADAALSIAGVLVFADARNGAVIGAKNAAVTGGVIQDCSENGDGVGFGLVSGDQFGQELAGQEGNIAVSDHHGAREFAFGIQGVQRDFHCTACAGNLVLVNNEGLGVQCRDVLGYPVPLVPDNQSELQRVNGPGCEEGVANH